MKSGEEFSGGKEKSGDSDNFCGLNSKEVLNLKLLVTPYSIIS